MTLKKFSRAGLLSLAFGILLGLFLSVAVYDASYAQTPAPAPAAARRGSGSRRAAAGLRRLGQAADPEQM